jgi:hypothetical protein
MPGSRLIRTKRMIWIARIGWPVGDALSAWVDLSAHQHYIAGFYHA